MKNRSVGMVIVLTLLTLFIYGIIWYWQNAQSMKKQGMDVPHPILIIIPIANLYFMYKFYAGIEKVSNGEKSGIMMFVLALVLGIIGQMVAIAMSQSAINDAVAKGGVTA